MKKILFLLLLTIYGLQAQTYQNPTYGTLTLKTSPTVNAHPYLTTTESNGVQSKVVSVMNQNANTGLLSGGVISVNADPTKWNLAFGEGYVADPLNGTVAKVAWGTQSALTTPYLTTSTATYVLIANAGGGIGSVLLQNTPPTQQQYRTHVYLGKLAHTTKTTILFAVPEPSRMYDAIGQIMDLNSALKSMNVEGNTLSANGANLNLNISAGKIYRAGANYASDRNNPSLTTLSSGTAITFRNKFRDGSGGWNAVNTSIVDADYYDDGTGILATVPNNKYTVRVAWRFGGTGTVHLDYGQAVYNTLAEAKASIPTAIVVKDPDNVKDAVIIGWIVVKKGTTALNNTAENEFLRGGMFGESALSAGGTTTMQGAYNNSVSPQIVTSITGGAVAIKQGSGSDTDNILVGQNGAGSNTFTVTGAGNITAGTFNGYTPENQSNKSDSYTVSSSTTYASTKAVVDGLATKLNSSTYTATPTATAFSHYFGETASDGIIRPKTLANVKTEIVTTAAVDAAKSNIVTGTGTNTSIVKWTGTNTVGNSNITDNGTIVSVSTDMSANGMRVGRGVGNDNTNTVLSANGLSANTTGLNLTSIGYNSLSANTTGVQNLGLGYNTLTNNTTGNANLAIGTATLYSITSGSSNNVAIGTGALVNATSINRNTSIGDSSFFSLLSGDDNVGIGRDAGRLDSTGANLTSASSTTLIGYATKPLGSGQTNQLVVGYDATGLGSNTSVYGNSSTTYGRWWGNLLLGTSTNDGSLLRVSGTANINTLNLTNTSDTATASTHYFVETGSDGIVRPKTLANTRTEIVTTAAVDAAKANIMSGSIATNYFPKSSGSGNFNASAWYQPNGMETYTTTSLIVKDFVIDSKFSFCHALGNSAFQNLTSGSNSFAFGVNSGNLSESGSPLTSVTQSIFLGAGARAKNTTSIEEIVIGTNGAVGLGDYTYSIGAEGRTIYGTLFGNLVLGKKTNNGNQLQVNGTADIDILQLNTTPTTSAGSYNILTRNSSTGVVEKVASNTYATLASPAFTGTPTAPTPTTGTGIANKDYVDSATGNYKKYVALVSQSGTSAPTAIVLENTTGATVTFARSALGTYTATFSSSVLTLDKTTTILTNSYTDGIATSGRASDTVINIYTTKVNPSYAFSDDRLSKSTIEIRIYP